MQEPYEAMYQPMMEMVWCIRRKESLWGRNGCYEEE